MKLSAKYIRLTKFLSQLYKEIQCLFDIRNKAFNSFYIYFIMKRVMRRKESGSRDFHLPPLQQETHM